MWLAIPTTSTTTTAITTRTSPGKTAKPTEIERYLGSLHLEDLALACACALGNDAAWEHFILEYRPALYRAATSLVFPSTKEGFGLVVLEAMASGVPVVTSRGAPFIEYLGDDDVAWCDPFDVASIADAMAASLDAARRHLAVHGEALLERTIAASLGLSRSYCP